MVKKSQMGPKLAILSEGKMSWFLRLRLNFYHRIGNWFYIPIFCFIQTVLLNCFILALIIKSKKSVSLPSLRHLNRNKAFLNSPLEDTLISFKVFLKGKMLLKFFTALLRFNWNTEKCIYFQVYSLLGFGICIHHQHNPERQTVIIPKFLSLPNPKKPLICCY